MWADTLLLMKLYWKIDRREATGQSRWRVVALIAAGLGLLFIGVVSGFAGWGASFLLRPELSVRLTDWIVPALLLTFVLVSVLVTGLGQAVKALYMSGDLDRLIVAPLRLRSVLIAKLLSRLPSHILILLFAATPAFIAYGIGVGAGPIYYLLGAILLLVAPLFGLAVGALIAMLLARVLPAKRLNELLAASYALLGITIAIAFQFPRFINYDNVSDDTTVAGLSGLAAALERLPLPQFWAARGLMELDALAPTAVGLLGLIAYMLLTIGLFLAVALWADSLYLSGWLRTQSAGGKRRGLDEADAVFGGRSLPVALGVKDWLLRLRDPRQLVSLLGGAVIMIVVVALSLFRGSGGEPGMLEAAQSGELSDLPGGWAMLGAAFSPGVIIAAWMLFMPVATLMNAASSALALEGGSFALLKAAPVSPREVWRAKTWSVVLPFILLFTLFMIGGWFLVRYSLAWLPYAFIAGVLLAWGLMTANVSVGFRYANLGWVDPRRMTTAGGGWVSLLLTLAYGVPAALLTLLPFVLAQGYPRWTWLFVAVGLALLAALTWAWGELMARWAVRSWDVLPA
jgi:ABC-2 type transport system permease protein